MSYITSANVANAIAKLIAADVLPALLGEMVMGNLVTRDFEPVIHQEGSCIAFPATNTPVRLKLVSASFRVPDVTKVLAVPDLLRIYMQPAVSKIANEIDGELLSLYSGFSSSGPQIEGANAVPVLDSVNDTLFGSLSNVRYLVCDAGLYTRLRQIHGFSEYDSASSAGLRALIDGTVGKYRDLYVLRSVNVPKTEVRQNLAFTRSSIGLATRRLPQPLPGTGKVCEYAELGNFGMRVTMQYQPNTLSQDFEIDVLQGSAILRQDEGVQVPS